MRRAALILGLLAASIPHARLAGLPSYNEQFGERPFTLQVRQPLELLSSYRAGVHR